MKLAVGVLTHRTVHYDRVELLKSTVASLEMGLPYSNWPIVLYDNSPCDWWEQEEELRSQRTGARLVQGWKRAPSSEDMIFTCGRGMNETINELVDTGADLIVFSNDDIYWKMGWYEKLINFWEKAPDDLLLLSGMVCRTYSFNEPIEAVSYGGTKAVVRGSATGGAWTLRAKDWPKIYPVNEAPNDDDVRKCIELRQKGYRVAEADLVEHMGADKSTWGNTGWTQGEPLDFKKWGLE